MGSGLRGCDSWRNFWWRGGRKAKTETGTTDELSGMAEGAQKAGAILRAA
jgi:hypothetical protein